MIYDFFKIYLQKNTLNAVRDIFCYVIGCSIGLYGFIFRKSSINP